MEKSLHDIGFVCAHKDKPNLVFILKKKKKFQIEKRDELSFRMRLCKYFFQFFNGIMRIYLCGGQTAMSQQFFYII